jgi:hypothetical protein
MARGLDCNWQKKQVFKALPKHIPAKPPKLSHIPAKPPEADRKLTMGPASPANVHHKIAKLNVGFALAWPK